MLMPKRSSLQVIFYILLSILPLSVGVYVLLEKKMIVGGRLAAGHVQELLFPANIIMALSFFLISLSVLVAITNLKYKNKMVEWFFISAIALFGVSVFL